MVREIRDLVGLDTTIIFALSHLLKNGGIEVRQILLMVFFLKLCYGGGFQSKLLAWLPNHYNPIIRVHAYMHRKKKHHLTKRLLPLKLPSEKKVRQKSWLFNLHVMPRGSVGCKRAAQELTIRTCMWCQGYQIWISMRHLACRLFLWIRSVFNIQIIVEACDMWAICIFYARGWVNKTLISKKTVVGTIENNSSPWYGMLLPWHSYEQYIYKRNGPNKTIP